MNLQTIAINTLWGGVFAGSLAVRLTAPRRYLVTSFLAGAAGRFVFVSSIMSSGVPSVEKGRPERLTSPQGGSEWSERGGMFHISSLAQRACSPTSRSRR